MKNLSKNWRTTITGFLLLGFGVVLFIIDRPIEAGLAVTAGLGFINAKDGNVTGVGDSAKTQQEMEK